MGGLDSGRDLHHCGYLSLAIARCLMLVNLRFRFESPSTVKYDNCSLNKNSPDINVRAILLERCL